MAHYSVHVGTVKRSVGQNAIESAAYISRSRLTLHQVDKEYNIPVSFTYNYSQKGGLAFSKIYLPENAPEWASDRQQLWNKAELVENRCDAVPAGKIMVALPKELSDEQNIELLEKIVDELVKLGMVVDANIHNDSDGNPHMHLQYAFREFVQNKYGEYEFSRLKNRDWQGPEWTRCIREMTAGMINESYLENGFSERVTHKSYKELGIDLTPSVHEGPARNMHNAELTELNRQIAAENAEKIKEKPSIILDILALNRPVFTKEQIAKELEKRLHAGIDFGKIDDIEAIQKELSETFLTLYESILAGPDLTQIVESDLKGNALYTTTKRLELEERFEINIKALHAKNDHALNIKDSDLDRLSWKESISVKLADVKSDIIDAINDKTNLELAKPKSEVTLSEEQRRAVVNVLNGSDISVLEGIPGAGKTTVMKEIVRQYEKAGYKVIGAAPSSAASLELAKATGIECKNISQWRKTWVEARGEKFKLALKGDYYKEDVYQKAGSGLTKKHVVIIDEASMEELANADYFVSEAKAAGAKIIKIGDRNQISPVGWCGALDKTIEVAGSEQLMESRRQQKASHQEATKLLAQYRVREALDIYWKEGRIKVAGSKAGANSMMANNFVSSYIETAKSLKSDALIATNAKVIGVYENKTRRLLNENVRTALKEAGILKGEEHRVLVGAEIKDGKKELQYLNLCRGEQIVFSKNANRIGSNGIFNGELGTILKVHKPNKDALAKLDILMHRSDGTKEKARLDLAELATNRHTGKYFFDKSQIEYGYAVTAHKVQGGSKLGAEILIEKNTGFEIFNVLATRHKEDVQFVVDKETLNDVFYESMDETSSKARNSYEFGQSDEETILKSGLAKLVSKRTNTSFASEYRTLGLTVEDKYIKEYLDKSEETIAIVRNIADWQSIQKRKTGIKPPMWRHKDWNEFKKIRGGRAEAASTIIAGFASNGERVGDARESYQHLTDMEYRSECKKASYEKFRKRLMQTGINYTTLEKHASQNLNKDSQFDKVEWKEKESLLFGQAEFKDLVDAVASGNSSRCRRSYLLIESNIAARELAIEEKVGKQVELEDTRQEFIDAIGDWKYFREKLTPEYLNRIYRIEASGDEMLAGGEAIKNYEELIAKHGADKAVSMVVKNPKLLGDLKGYGVGKLFGLNDDRKDAIALCKNLGKQLGAYNRSGEMVDKFEAKMQEADFGKKLYELSEEIEDLRALLPEGIDKKFLNEVNLKLKSSKGNNIDWRNLQKSELFDSIRAEIYMPKESNMFDISDMLIIDKQETRGVKAEKEPIDISKSEKLSTVDNDSLKNYLQERSKEAKQQQAKATGNTNYKAQLTFAEVKAGLSQSVITDIFHRYGPMMNSDAKIERKGDQLKLGSLYMSVSGSKAGLWNRFSMDGSKGDIFKFVEMATGCSKHEALEIVASHAGVTPSINNVGASGNTKKIEEQATQGKKYKLKETNVFGQKQDVWIANAIVPVSASKFKPEKDLSFLIKQRSEITNTYEYRNIDNELLGYTVRIIEKSSGNKQVLPVAYCYNEAKGKSRWQLKGISDNGTKPIYKLEQISTNPEKPILIVEGEKTADKAQVLLSDYNVVSWIGGAGAVDKVDWSKLKDKVVSIWPDNDEAGIGAARKIANHIDCQNGFKGLVSIVDTEKLLLPEKWDLADDVPDTSNLANIGINGAIEEARVNSKSIGDELQVSQGDINDEKGSNRVLDSIEMLTKSSKLHKDEYISKSVYSNSINAIASSKGQDLGNIEDHKEFIRVVNDASYKYQSLQSEYRQRQLKGQSEAQVHETKNQLFSEIVRDISILHQVQLRVRELPKIHIEHIELAASEKLKNISDVRINDSYKEMIANNVYKVVSSKEWAAELDDKQMQVAHSISVKYTAKTIDEFLSNDNDTAMSDLANIRTIGMDESGIFASFKEDHNKGIDVLKATSDKVTMASGFAAENKAIIDEAKRFGYGADYAETVRSLVGMDNIQSKAFCMEINNSSLQEYLHKNLSELQRQKQNKFLLEELKPLIYAEQEFLKETYQATNTPTNCFVLKNRDYLESGKEFLENPEIVSNTFKLAEQLIEQTNKTEPEVARYMNSGRSNINYIHSFLNKQLKHHAYYTRPNMLSQERQKSQDIETVFKAIEKEQNIYADMKGNILHHSFDAKLLQKAETAFVQKENNELNKLKDIAQKSLDIGAKSKDSLLEDLQNISDLKKSQEKISGSIENYKLGQMLNGFELQKEKCKTPLEVLAILQERQNYLFNNELKYREYIEKKHLQIISQNQIEKQESRLDNLNKVVEFVVSEKLHTNTEILNYLKSSNSIKKSEALLIQSYQNKYLNDLEKNLNAIEKEGKLNINDMSFDCQKKYIDFKANSLNKEYAPQDELQQKQQQIKESQNQKTVEVSKGFGDFER